MCVPTPPQEYYSAIERNEIVTSVITQMDLEDIRQSKISDEKDKYHLHCGTGKQNRLVTLTKNRFIGNKLEVTSGEREEEGLNRRD